MPGAHRAPGIFLFPLPWYFIIFHNPFKKVVSLNDGQSTLALSTNVKQDLIEYSTGTRHVQEAAKVQVRVP